MVEMSSKKQASSITGKTRQLMLQENAMLHSPLLIGALIFLTAMGFNCYRLGVPSLWFDEVYSVELVRHPFNQVWTIIFSWQPNMELYYLLLYGWLRLLATFGWTATEFAVRFPSALYASSSAVVVFAFGRRFISTLPELVYPVCRLDKQAPLEPILGQLRHRDGPSHLYAPDKWHYATDPGHRRWGIAAGSEMEKILLAARACICR